jgi:hypothetical protein
VRQTNERVALGERIGTLTDEVRITNARVDQLVAQVRELTAAQEESSAGAHHSDWGVAIAVNESGQS